MPVERREAPTAPVGVGVTRHDVDSNAFPALVVSPDPESDYWFAASLSAGASGYGQYETAVDLPDAAIEAALLRVHLYGGWNLSDETAQRVVIHVNGVPLDTVEVAAIGTQAFRSPSTLRYCARATINCCSGPSPTCRPPSRASMSIASRSSSTGSSPRRNRSSSLWRWRTSR